MLPMIPPSTGVSGSNFRLGILMLPAPQRAAVKAIYGFCRASDDATDLDPAGGADRLAHWRRELDLCFAGRPRDPLLRALAPHVKTFGLKREYFDALLKGYEMDLARRRYQSIEELEEYCDCVAGAVGLLCLQVFGVHEEEAARTYSLHLSRGLQLVNILRDLGEDAARGRVYLPADDLAMMGYTEAQLKAREATVEYFKLGRFEANRARSAFAKAVDVFLKAPALRRRLLGAEIMRETYAALLRKIEQHLERGLDGQPVKLSRLERYGVALGAWVSFKLTG